MLNKLLKLWLSKAEPDTPDADLIGDDLDFALGTHSDLLENGCRDEQLLEISRERIMDLQLRYQAAKLQQLEQIK